MMAGGMYDVGKLVATLGLNTTPFMAGAAGAQASLKALQMSMMMTGRAMTRFITLPMAIAGGASIMMHKKFEASMTKIIGLVGVARGTVEEWSDAILDMAREVGKGPAELADAMFFIASAGIRGAKALEVLEMSAKGSAVGMGDTKTIADLVTSAMNAYGHANLSAAEAVDVLTAAVREGKAEADSLAGAMGMVLPIASEFGVTFDQVGAAFAGMTRTGTNARVAATQLKAILSAMASPSEQSAAALARFSLKAEDFRRIVRDEGLIEGLLAFREATLGNEEALSEIFPNIRALMGVLDLLGQNLQANIRIFESLKNSTGSLKRAFEEIQDTTQFKVDKALAGLGVTAIQLGETLKGPFIKALTNISTKLEIATDNFRQLTDVQKQAKLAILGVIAVAGPLFVVLSRLSMIAFSQPWFAAIAVLATLVASLLVYRNVLRSATAEEVAQQRINEKVNDTISEQKKRVDELMTVAKDETKGLEQRKEALDALNGISPTYFGNLTKETIATERAAVAMIFYNKQLILNARIEENKNLLKAQDELISKMNQTNSITNRWKMNFLHVADLFEFIAKGAAGIPNIISVSEMHQAGLLSDLEKEVAIREIIKQDLALAAKDLGGIENAHAAALANIIAMEEALKNIGKVDNNRIRTSQYLYELEQDIKYQKGQVTAASRENLAVENDKLRVLQRELEMAHALTKAEGDFGDIARYVTLLKSQQNDLSGQALLDNIESINQMEKMKQLIILYVGGYGELERLDQDILDLEEEQANASGKKREDLTRQLWLLNEMKAIMSSIAHPLDEPPTEEESKVGSFAFDDYHRRRIAAAEDANAAILKDFRGTQAEMAEVTKYYNTIIQESLNALADSGKERWYAAAAAAQAAIGAVQGFLNVAMNRELKAAGDNEKKKEEIEKKYLKKRKQWSIAQAMINTAVGVTKALDLGWPLSLIGIALAIATGAAQVAAISAQSFASGGLVYGTTLAQVGDYPGASNNPEVIAPLDKLKKYMNPTKTEMPKYIKLVAEGPDLVATIDTEMLTRQTY